MNILLLSQKIKEQYSYIASRDSELRIHCPFCEKRVGKDDTKYHMYINVSKNLFWCFRCEAKGAASRLVQGLNYAFDLQSALQSKTPRFQETSLKDIEQLPDNIIALDDLDDDHPAHVYLRSRISPFQYMQYEIYYCDNYVRNNKEYGPRLIFPVFQEGQYLGFQARSIVDTEELRYVGAYNFDKRRALFNWINAKSSSRLILAEGIFDALAIGSDAVAVFGKHLSVLQKDIISQKHFDEIYCFFDKDALKNAHQTAKILSRYVDKCYYINYDVKDPGIMSRSKIDYLLNHRTFWPDYGAIRVY